MCFLLQDSRGATADTVEDRAPGSRGDSAEDITARKATALFRARARAHTHTLTLTDTERLVAGNSHPVIFNCSLLMY